MSRKPVKLCPEDCTTYHTKKEVADILGVSVATVYNYIKDGLRENKAGVIYCPWIRAYYQEPTERKSA
jgi:DNA invertase Pin-like site-specific DNA recombinase